METIFNKIDNFNFTFLGFNPIGALKNIGVWRKYVLILLSFAGISGIIFGWESTWMQPFTYIKNIPLLLTGQTTLQILGEQSIQHYGLGQHLSTAVIYGFCFILLSIHLEKIGVRKSLNFAATVALSFMSVGIYEIIYNVLYSNLQSQPWTFSLQWQQGLNIVMFFFFTATGMICLLYFKSLNFKLNFSMFTRFLILMSFLTYSVWVFYPLQAQTITMGTTAGIWTSSKLFPQTMYAVDTNPLDNRAIGDPVFVENNLLHLVNILNKVFVSFAILNIVRIKRKDEIL